MYRGGGPELSLLFALAFEGCELAASDGAGTAGVVEPMGRDILVR